MRSVVAVTGGLVLVLAGCGSSSSSQAKTPASASASASPSASPSVSAPAAPVSAGASTPPSVGPTDPNQSPGPKPATIDLQVVKRGGQALIIAPVMIHGRTYQFIVDTGATATLISTDYAAALGLVRTKSAPIPVAGVTGSGTAYLATINDWQIGRAKIPTSTITVSTLNLGAGIVGLLGSDVLSTFGKVTINYSTQQASLG